MNNLADLSFDSMVTGLRDKAAQFAAAYSQFLANESDASQDPQLYADWQSANTYAGAIKDTIQYINNQVDAASNWLGSTFGMNGLGSLRGQKGLGFLPLVPIAYIIAASAALTYAYSLVVASNNAVQNYRIKAGIVSAGGDPSLLDAQATGTTVSNIIKWGIIAVAAYFIIPKLLKEYRS
jgi:hypothetical protein